MQRAMPEAMLKTFVDAVLEAMLKAFLEAMLRATHFFRAILNATLKAF